MARNYSIPTSVLIVPMYNGFRSLDVIDSKSKASWCVRKNQNFMEKCSDKLAAATVGKKKRAKKRMYIKKSAGFIGVDLTVYDTYGACGSWKNIVASADYEFASFGVQPIMRNISDENILYMNQVTERLEKIIRGVCMYVVAKDDDHDDNYERRSKVMGMIYSHPKDKVLIDSQAGLIGVKIANG